MPNQDDIKRSRLAQEISDKQAAVKYKGRTDLQGNPSWWSYSGDPLTATEADRKDYDEWKARTIAASHNVGWEHRATTANSSQLPAPVPIHTDESK